MRARGSTATTTSFITPSACARPAPARRVRHLKAVWAWAPGVKTPLVMRPRNEWPTETGVGMSGPVRHEHEDTRPVKKVKWHRLSTTGPLLAAAATAAGWRSSPKSLAPDGEPRRTRSSFRNDGTGRSLGPLPAAPTAANRRLD